MFEISRDDEARIRLRGRFDAKHADAAEEFLDGISSTTVVDFEELTYLSSSALGLLFACQKRLKDHGEELRLVNLNPHIREVFKIAGFDAIFVIE